jgi:hypothetical protein
MDSELLNAEDQWSVRGATAGVKTETAQAHVEYIHLEGRKIAQGFAPWLL